MNSNFQYTSAVQSEPITTLAKRYKPGNITKTHLSDFKLSSKSNKTIEVLITWEPADDRTCHYYIYSYALKDENDDMKTVVITQVSLVLSIQRKNI